MFSTLKRNPVRIALAVVVALVGTTVACESDEQVAKPPGPISQIGLPVWVAIEPTQCLTNPWEADWLAQHNDDYAAYPKDYATPGLEPGEIAIIKDYYARHGVTVSQTATVQKYEVICAACSCPEGHTLYLQVEVEDVETMIGFGYRREAPPTGG